jgi:curved DNA-binding protein CbpA
MKNLYRVLGVRLDASPEEIKSAYRKKAREHHPDRSGDPKEFLEIAQAYEVLSDPEARSRYEVERAAWMQAQGAIPCIPCGAANRIRKSAGSIACGQCKAPLVIPSTPPASAFEGTKKKLLEKTVELAEDTGSVLAAEVSDLLVDGISAGFGRLRNRMGLRDRRRPSR